MASLRQPENYRANFSLHPSDSNRATNNSPGTIKRTAISQEPRALLEGNFHRLNGNSQSMERREHG